MRRLATVAFLLGSVVVLAGLAGAQRSSERPVDTLEGTLRVHPKFHFRYYLDGFGDGQHCALFEADDRLREIKPGTPIRVRGRLASRFFGDGADPMPALISTWIIYMDVTEVEVAATRR
jgi:hypothetical protein